MGSVLKIFKLSDLLADVTEDYILQVALAEEILNFPNSDYHVTFIFPGLNYSAVQYGKDSVHMEAVGEDESNLQFIKLKQNVGSGVLSLCSRYCADFFSIDAAHLQRVLNGSGEKVWFNGAYNAVSKQRDRLFVDINSISDNEIIRLTSKAVSVTNSLIDTGIDPSLNILDAFIAVRPRRNDAECISDLKQIRQAIGIDDEVPLAVRESKLSYPNNDVNGFIRLGYFQTKRSVTKTSFRQVPP